MRKPFNPHYVFMTALIITGGAALQLNAAETVNTPYTLTDPTDVDLAGPIGNDLARSLARLDQPPFTLPWLRADLTCEMARPFTNFSGDVSGRYTQIASLSSSKATTEPANLSGMLGTLKRFQKPDGHFGAPVDWNNNQQVMKVGTPILWGNARLLIGVLSAYDRDHNPELLKIARGIGDFYLHTADLLCNPDKQHALRNSVNYYSGFDVCYFPAIESLTRLSVASGDEDYLNLAKQMASLFYTWDRLPYPHTHGNLCSQLGLLALYRATGDHSYLDYVEHKYDLIVAGGYVNPTGGVGENFTINSKRDEGCAESDWLRTNLELWSLTADPRYLDMADRLIHNEYIANQFPDGGWGNRFLESDAVGVDALLAPSEEAVWCCAFHGALGLYLFKSGVVVGDESGIALNFPVDCTATVRVGKNNWTATTAVHDSPQSLNCEMTINSADPGLSTPLQIRMPQWCGEITATTSTGQRVPLTAAVNGQVTTPPIPSSTKLQLTYSKPLRIEDRHLRPVTLPTQATLLKSVVLSRGPSLLYASVPSGPATLLVVREPSGVLELPVDGAGNTLSVQLPANVSASSASDVVGRHITLGAFNALPASPRKLFVFDVLVVPSDSPLAGQLAAATVQNGK